MKYSAATLFAGAAIAGAAVLPPSTVCGENVNIAGYTFEFDNTGANSFSFNVTGVDGIPVTCSTGKVEPGLTIPSKVFGCGDSKYAFSVGTDGSNGVDLSNPQYDITLYKETGPGVGLWAETHIPSACARSEETSPLACSQVSTVYGFLLNCT